MWGATGMVAAYGELLRLCLCITRPAFAGDSESDEGLIYGQSSSSSEIKEDRVGMWLLEVRSSITSASSRPDVFISENFSEG